MTDAEYPWLSSYPDNVDWHAPLKGRPLYELLDDAAKRFPNNTALRFMGRGISYAELDLQVKKLKIGRAHV